MRFWLGLGLKRALPKAFLPIFNALAHLAAMGMAARDEPQVQGMVLGRGCHPQVTLWAQGKLFLIGLIPAVLAHGCAWLICSQPVPISWSSHGGGISVRVHNVLPGHLNKSPTR